MNLAHERPTEQELAEDVPGGHLDAGVKGGDVGGQHAKGRSRGDVYGGDRQIDVGVRCRGRDLQRASSDEHVAGSAWSVDVGQEARLGITDLERADGAAERLHGTRRDVQGWDASDDDFAACCRTGR